MAHKVRKTIRMGNKSKVVEISIASPKVDYSGFGAHGPNKKARIRAERRKNRKEASEISE